MLEAECSSKYNAMKKKATWTCSGCTMCECSGMHLSFSNVDGVAGPLAPVAVGAGRMCNGAHCPTSVLVVS
jgi:hypothetical protein